MRIAHVSDCYLPRLGGIERQVHELAVRQRRAGHDVAVVTSAPGLEQERAEQGSAEEGDPEGGGPEGGRDGVQVFAPGRFPGVNPARVRWDRSLRGRRAVLTGGFDLVHVHASSFSPLAFLTAEAASRAGIPTALTAHSLLADHAPLFRWADSVVRWSRWPVAWSAVSTVAARPLQQILGPSIDVAVLPNGVDPAVWKVTRTSSDPARIVVASVGRLAVRKRPLALVRMLRTVRSQLPADIRLEGVLVGDGPLRPKIERYVARHGMQSWISLPGAACHSQIRELYADADMYVAPATLESFGIAALEARCAGLPVVAHSGSGVADFITNGVDGFLVDDDNHMVESITSLCASPLVRDRMRGHIRAEAPSIDWCTVLDATDDLYERARALALPVGRVTLPAGLA